MAAWSSSSAARGVMRTSRPVADKLGAVRQDPDIHSLLFILINRATGGRQERAAQLCHPEGDTGKVGG